jgi:hypothetical protein
MSNMMTVRSDREIDAAVRETPAAGIGTIYMAVLEVVGAFKYLAYQPVQRT